MKPTTSYLVCSTPRSGTGLFCGSLRDTDLAGYPDEYFQSDVESEYSRNWEISDYSSYLHKVIEYGTSPNGVFGAKLMWDQVSKFKRNVLIRAPRSARFRLYDLLQSLFPNLHYVWLSRRDKVRQAVSFYKAMKTGIYRSNDVRSNNNIDTIKFDYKAIHHLVRKLERWDQRWKDFFQRNNIQPFTVIYEDHLEHDCRETIIRFLNHLEVAVPSKLPYREDHKKLADKHSDHFVQLYYECSK